MNYQQQYPYQQYPYNQQPYQYYQPTSGQYVAPSAPPMPSNVQYPYQQPYQYSQQHYYNTQYYSPYTQNPSSVPTNYKKK